MADSDKHSALPATEKEAALLRIEYYRYRGKKGKGKEPDIDYGNIVNWFIRLARAQKPLREMAASELELLKLEYRALQEEALPYYENAVTVDMLEKFRDTIRRHLEEYADKRQTTLGPFTLTRFVYQPKPGDRDRIHRGQSVFVGTLLEPGNGQGLLHLLSVLLERIDLAVLRCPQCHHVFLQPRRDARFCSRRCQANFSARIQRERANKTVPNQSLRKRPAAKPRRSARVK